MSGRSVQVPGPPIVRLHTLHVAHSTPRHREIGTKGCGQALIEMPTPAHVLRLWRPPANRPLPAWVPGMNCWFRRRRRGKIMLHQCSAQAEQVR